MDGVSWLCLSLYLGISHCLIVCLIFLLISSMILYLLLFLPFLSLISTCYLANPIYFGLFIRFSLNYGLFQMQSPLYYLPYYFIFAYVFIPPFSIYFCIIASHSHSHIGPIVFSHSFQINSPIYHLLYTPFHITPSAHHYYYCWLTLHPLGRVIFIVSCTS